MTPTILIVEDEPAFSELLSFWFAQAGYRALVAGTAKEGLRQFHDERPNIVVLDLALPDADGWTVIERIRDFSSVPIIVVTARSGEADRIRGLRLGADDYVVKPFSLPELQARVEAALRRASTTGGDAPPVLRYRDLSVDVAEHRVQRDDRAIRLTPTEFRLLVFLMERAGQLVTHQQALVGVWGRAYASDGHLLRMMVSNLRQKLQGKDKAANYISTEYGVGYRFGE
jgi:two-component system, OmpR family, KDP operon response regulator KdpE